MNDIEYQFLAKFLKDRSGISISKEKCYLFESRLPQIAKRHNIENLTKLVEALRLQPSGALANDVIDTMTTNESFFFRDTKPFDQLKKIILPKFINRKLRIWSAAASTGQEAYSIAMTCEEANFKSFEIIGTDLSPTVIERAKEGKYTQFEIQRGLPVIMMVKYFEQKGDVWHIKPTLKEKIKFDIFNLLDPYTRFENFDVVYIRNVLIYFERDTKRQILDKIAAKMNKGGYLLLGASETLFDLSDKFKPVEGENGLYYLV